MGLALGLLAFDTFLAAYVNFDLLRLGFGTLGQPDGQHAIKKFWS
jgi:hypothetical protein